MPHKHESGAGMAVSIFGHLDFEQRKWLETRTVHNDDRVKKKNAPERRGVWTFVCMPHQSSQNESKLNGTEKEKRCLPIWWRTLFPVSYWLSILSAPPECRVQAILSYCTGLTGNSIPSWSSYRILKCYSISSVKISRKMVVYRFLVLFLFDIAIMVIAPLFFSILIW